MSEPIRTIAGNIHSVESFGAVDGPGVRFVVFFQGCPLRCLYCHNPDSWKFSEGESKTAGELIDQILDYRNFIQKGGVTLSGGEPLAQPEFCQALLTLCRHYGLHTAIDTSGVIPLQQSKIAIDVADMLLLDMKDIDAKDCKTLTGQSNQNTIETLNYCESVQKPVWIRHVCVPNYTLKQEKLQRLAQFLKNYQCVTKVELIPFHQMGIYKWDYVDVAYQLANIPAPTVQEMEQAKELLLSYHLPV